MASFFTHYLSLQRSCNARILFVLLIDTYKRTTYYG